MKIKNILIAIYFLLPLQLISLNVIAAEGFEAAHKIVIQVSSSDPAVQKLALGNAVNLQKHYGLDNIKIEVVAYGPGLGILTLKSKYIKRISSLLAQDITFTACGNTIKTIVRKTGKKPRLIDGVDLVTTGVAHIIELQEKGYSYVKP